MKRVLVSDPDGDVVSLLEATLRRLGYEPVRDPREGPLPEVDAVVLEPGCREGRSLLRRLGDAAPPVICFSIYPREAGLAPPGSAAYVVKPGSRVQLGAALATLFAA
ncbi:MAG TPA: hypothetical protein VFJ77_07430 [Gaiellaceae bacterium]|nr:hypothetical protein [Gaiellaceae bacterium]